MPTYKNDYGYSRTFSDLDGRTVELGPGEEITFDHEIDHPNLTLVDDSTERDTSPSVPFVPVGTPTSTTPPAADPAAE